MVAAVAAAMTRLAEARGVGPTVWPATYGRERGERRAEWSCVGVLS